MTRTVHVRIFQLCMSEYERCDAVVCNDSFCTLLSQTAPTCQPADLAGWLDGCCMASWLAGITSHILHTTSLHPITNPFSFIIYPSLAS